MTAIASKLAITEPGIYDGLSDADYHGDPIVGGSLSSTGARKIVADCPAKFEHERRHGRAATKAFDFGHAAHQMVLSVGPELRVIPDDILAANGAVSTKDAKAFVAEARADGAVPLKSDEHQQIQEMAAKLREHPVAGRLFRPGTGHAEQSAFWQDPTTGTWRRARFDWMTDPAAGRLIIADYKSAKSARPADFARSAIDYGYHQQDRWYCDAAIDLELSSDPAFLFVVQEKTAPYLVTVVELDSAARQIGAHLNREAIDTYAECSHTNVWPGYADDDVVLTALPAWYERTFEEIGL